MAMSPRPPPPTTPAIAEYPRMVPKAIVTPTIKDVLASTKSTLPIIVNVPAPILWAASITPLSTSFSADSIILAINGAAAIVKGERILKPETLATAIRIGNPASWEKAENARDKSNGTIDCVTDDEIISAYKLIAQNEGVFCEPSSAASVAGLIKANNMGLIYENSIITCTLTGNGLKDPDNAIKYGVSQVHKTKCDITEIVKNMGI